MPAHKRIHFDEHADKLIRQAYQSTSQKSGHVQKIAQRLGVSLTTINRRANYLGVVRSVHKTNIFWQEAEVELLEANAHKPVGSIIDLLIKAGFKRRTEHSILGKLRQLNIGQRQARTDAGIYSVAELSRLSGIGTRTLAGYINRGWLKAEKRTDITSLEYTVKAADLRRFIIDYTANVDILRCDKFWLVDLLTGNI